MLSFSGLAASVININTSENVNLNIPHTYISYAIFKFISTEELDTKKYESDLNFGNKVFNTFWYQFDSNLIFSVPVSYYLTIYDFLVQINDNLIFLVQVWNYLLIICYTYQSENKHLSDSKQCKSELENKNLSKLEWKLKLKKKLNCIKSHFANTW